MLKKIILFTLIAALNISNAVMAESTLTALKKIHSVDHKSEPEVFGLLFKSAKGLALKWDKSLAVEISRVYSIVISYNQNAYVVELINPATDKWKEKFEKILFTKLSKEQRKLYLEMKKNNKNEEKMGNG